MAPPTPAFVLMNRCRTLERWSRPARRSRSASFHCRSGAGDRGDGSAGGKFLDRGRVPGPGSQLDLLNGLLSVEANLTPGLENVLQFANEEGRSSVVAEPMFQLTDGETSTMNRTRRVPVENSFVNPESGVGSRTYAFQEVGLQFRVTLRELNWKSARTSIFISLGDIETAGIDGHPPITRQQEFTVSADMAACGVYLVVALRDGNKAASQRGGLKVGGLDRAEQTETLAFAPVARGAAPMVGGRRGSRTVPPSLQCLLL